MSTTPTEPRIPDGTGARIKARRQQLDLTQAKVAEMVRIKVGGRNYREGWLAQIERGRASLLLDAAIALADVLMMSMDEMFGRPSYAPVLPTAPYAARDEGASARDDDLIQWD